MLALAGVVVGISLLPAPSDEVREQVQRIVVREALQTALSDPRPEQHPPAAAPEPASPPPGFAPEDAPPRTDPPDLRRDWPRGDGGRPASSAAPASDGSWASALLWLLGLALLALLAIFLVAALRRAPRADVGLPARGGGPAPAQALPQAPYDEAEALAGAGRFDEAVHVLLLRALDLLARQAGLTLPPSLTSREVLARLPLTPGARQALATLVEAVEVSRFGGRALNADAWQQARAAWNAGRPGAERA